MTYFIKGLGFILLCTISLHAMALEGDIPIKNTEDLSHWCKVQVEQFYISRNLTPRQWHVLDASEGDNLKIEISYRINRTDYIAECKSKRNAPRKFAIFHEVGEKYTND